MFYYIAQQIAEQTPAVQQAGSELTISLAQQVEEDGDEVVDATDNIVKDCIQEICCPCEAVKELQAKYEIMQEKLSQESTHFERLDLQFEHIEKGITSIQEDLKELKEKPIKRYDAILGQVINVMLAILLTYLATMAGLQ